MLVAPGSDPGQIRLRIDGAMQLRFENNGDVVLVTAAGEIRQKKPLLYQGAGSRRRTIEGRYVRRGKNELGFQVAAYDPAERLVIDPVIVYSTLFGGSWSTTINGIAVDGAGNAYVTGSTASADLPQVNPLPLHDTPVAGTVAFVTKFNPAGNALVYSTFLGGPLPNGTPSGTTATGDAIALDAAGNAYVTGSTSSAYFPTTADAMQPHKGPHGGGQDAFVVKLGPDGGSLIYCTYLGGSGDEYAQGIAVDTSGNAYVAGWTNSTDFPTFNALQTTPGWRSGFVTKINPTGTGALFSTYLGGSSANYLQAIALDQNRNVYLTGWSISSDFPLRNALVGYESGGNAILTKIDSSGSGLVYSTFLPKTDWFLQGYGIAVDSGGNAVVVGDNFATRMNAAGSAWVYNLQFPNGTKAVAVDALGNAFIAGSDSCGSPIPLNPLPNSGCSQPDPGNLFVAALDPSGVKYFGTLLGGSASDGAKAIAVDTTGAIYVAGSTQSTDFPVQGGITYTDTGAPAFLTKISLNHAPVRPVSASPSSGSGSSQTFVFQFDDDNGPSDLTTASVQIAPAFATNDYSGTCTFHYVRPTNRLELWAGTAVWTGATPGASTTLQNGICTLDAASTTALWTGNRLTLTVNAAFLPALAGPNQTWMSATGVSPDSGWQQKGNWTVTAAPNIPSVISVSPNGGHGGMQTFVFRYADTSGADKLQTLYAWFTPAFGGNYSNTCMVSYDKPTLQWKLLGDDGVTWSSSLQNSQCSVIVQSPLASGNYLTATLAVDFNFAFNGVRQIWMYAADAAGNSGWQQRGVWTADHQEIITNSSYAPPSGASGNVYLTASDSDGESSLKSIWMWFTPVFSSAYANTCRFYWDRTTGRLNLMDDNGSTWSSTPLGTGTLQNSQCSLNSAGAQLQSATYLALPITLSRAFRGPKEVWINAQGVTAASGWQKSGAWTVPPVVVLDPGYFPGDTAGSFVTLSIVVNDDDGGQDVTSTWFWITPSFSSAYAGTCRAYYDSSTNTLNLMNDAGTGWLSAPLIYPWGTVLTNSQCSMQTTANQDFTSGNHRSLITVVRFNTAFYGVKEIWEYAQGGAGNTGWIKTGTLNYVAPGVPGNVSVTPNTGGGTAQNFTFHFSDSYGLPALRNVGMWFAPSTAGSSLSTCRVTFVPSYNLFNLDDDTGNQATAGTPGSPGVIQNSQCLLDLAASTVSPGADLAVTLALTFKAGFNGAKDIRMRAVDDFADTGYQKMGDWLVPTVPAPVITVGPASPSSGTGSQQIFTLHFSDTAGVNDLSALWVWFTGALTPNDLTNTCAVLYHPFSRAFELASDVGQLYGTTSNSQCSFSGASASAVGNDLTLTLPMAFGLYYNGPKNIYLYAAGSAGNSGWQSMGTWTVPPPPQLLSITKSHTGAFVRGLGGTYTVTVTNTGQVPAIGAVTITEVLPSSLGLVSMDGAGWTCIGGALSCTRNEALAAGASYPPITVMVNVAPNAPDQVTNRVNLSGGGSAVANASDVTAIGNLQPPSVVSVTPLPGAGSSQTFTFTVSDAAGASAVNGMYVMINSNINGASACYFEYHRPSNTVYLANDSNSATQGTTVVGSGAPVSNSQCTVSGTGGSVATNGNLLTVNLPITFKAIFAGTRNVYVYVDDSANLNSGWQTKGAWTVPGGSAPPSVVSMAPSSGSGSSQTFAFTVSDTAGASAVNGMYVMINSNINGASACYFEYHRPSNTVYLANDANSATQGTTVVGSGAPVSNSQCTIGGPGASATTNGNQLTLTLPVTFKAAFAGARNVYVYVDDSANLNSGWQTKGSWTVPGGSAPPSAISVSPASGSGLSQTFAFTVSDPAGAIAVNGIFVMINSNLNGAGACYFEYHRPSNTVYLANDANSATQGTTVVGSGAPVSNSQCTVSGTGGSVTTNGNQLTVNLPITFKPPFAGARNVYVYVDDSANLNSGWQTKGTWTVPGGSASPSAISVSPASGSGLSQTFAFTVSDPVGAAAVNGIFVMVNRTFSGANACYFEYHRPSNTVYLANDANSATQGTTVVGSGAAVSNSQCTVNGSGASVTMNGNQLTLSLPITFKTVFAGARNVYLYVDDSTNLNSGWQTKGAWIVPGGSTPPSVDSVTPSSGSGSAQTFAFTVSDAAGATAVNGIYVMVNNTFSGAAACYFEYHRPSNTVYLANDTNSATQGTTVVGSGAPVSNSQCTVNGAGASVTINGNQLTLNLPITFKVAFAGARNVYLYVDDGANLNSGWQNKAVWTVQ